MGHEVEKDLRTYLGNTVGVQNLITGLFLEIQPLIQKRNATNAKWNLGGKKRACVVLFWDMGRDIKAKLIVKKKENIKFTDVDMEVSIRLRNGEALLQK